MKLGMQLETGTGIESGIYKEMMIMQESERIRKLLGVSRAEFSRRYHIPIRTLEDWDADRKKPPVYVMELLERAVKEDLKAYKK